MARLAQVEIDAGRPAEAAALYERALARRPGERRWRLTLVELLRGLKRTDDALDHVQDLLRRNPGDGDIAALARALSIEHAQVQRDNATAAGDPTSQPAGE